MNRLAVNRSDLSLLLFFAGILLAITVFAGGLAELVRRWATQEEYGHGFFIPLITLWLLWQRREALRSSLATPSWSGVLLMLAATAFLILGELTAIFIIVQYGFLLSLVALIFCFGGVPLARVSILPIAFLIFAIPLPYFVDAQLSWRMQLLSSQIGVGILRALGVSVFLEGNVVDLGAYKLQVVDACSGLRYLYPLLSIGFLMSYLYQASLPRRIVLFLTTIPITVLMNSLRIAAVGVLVQRWGSGAADGFLHYFEGWVIFIACLALLVAEVWIFERFGERRQVTGALYLPTIKGAGSTARYVKAIRNPLIFGIALLVIAGIAARVASERVEVKPARTPLAAFPLELGDWKANEQHLDPQIEKSLGLEDYVIADYNNGNKLVNFYVAYYGSQRKGVSPHSPQVCIPGGGWLITALDRVQVSATGSTFDVNRTIIERSGERQLVYYWFEQRGRRIANEYLMKWFLLVDAVVLNRTDGALVRVVTPVGDSESIEEADRRAKGFIELALPPLAKFVPH